jgi:hypothetical protein
VSIFGFKKVISRDRNMVEVNLGYAHQNMPRGFEMYE